jgi:hypothetical protein
MNDKEKILEALGKANFAKVFELIEKYIKEGTLFIDGVDAKAQLEAFRLEFEKKLMDVYYVSRFEIFIKDKIQSNSNPDTFMMLKNLGIIFFILGSMLAGAIYWFWIPKKLVLIISIDGNIPEKEEGVVTIESGWFKESENTIKKQAVFYIPRPPKDIPIAQISKFYATIKIGQIKDTIVEISTNKLIDMNEQGGSYIKEVKVVIPEKKKHSEEKKSPVEPAQSTIQQSPTPYKWRIKAPDGTKVCQADCCAIAKNGYAYVIINNPDYTKNYTLTYNRCVNDTLEEFIYMVGLANIDVEPSNWIKTTNKCPSDSY